MIRSHFLHNLIAHPAMALLHGAADLADHPCVSRLRRWLNGAGDWVHNELIVEPGNDHQQGE